MKRKDGKCEDGLGHLSRRPAAKWCVRLGAGKFNHFHSHRCGTHIKTFNPQIKVISVAQCPDPDGAR